MHTHTTHTGKKYVLTFKPPSETRDRTTPVSDQRDCPPPPLALTAQDCVPRRRRHIAGDTAQGGVGEGKYGSQVVGP